MSRGLGVMEQAILAALDQLHAAREAHWEEPTWPHRYMASAEQELLYMDRAVYRLALVRREAYRQRGAGDWYSHTTAFSRAFVRLCQRRLLLKVWDSERFQRCRKCGHVNHPPARDASVVDLRKW